MAYKGKPEVRLAGLTAINGEELALQMSGTPASAATVSAKAGQAPAPSADVSGEAQADDADDTDLDDLLAGFDDDDGDEDAGDNEEMDPDLAALLASFE